MKTKEFIKKVESMGYKVAETKYKFYVNADEEHTLLSVSKCHQFKAGLNYPDPLTPELFSLAVEYAKIPISKRSTKQHVKIKGLSLSSGDGLYLNFDPINVNYFIADLNGYFKTEFTDDEIDELVNNPDFFLQTGNYETEEVDQHGNIIVFYHHDINIYANYCMAY